MIDFNIKIASQKVKITVSDDFQSIENRIGYELPSDYKQFLLKYQGQINFDMNYILVDFGNDFIDKVAVYILSDIDSVL